MSLFGKDPRYLYGAIRNAQLAPVIYPGWAIRFYIANGNSDDSLVIPHRIAVNLISLGAELSIVSWTEQLYIKPRYWRYLVADDEKVNAFLIRNVDARLTDRDKSAVDEWLNSTETLHTVRDHPKYENIAIPEGLWGARRKEFIAALGIPMRESLLKTGDMQISVLKSLSTISILCHSSNGCARNTTDTMDYCHRFPMNNRTDSVYGLEYVGQRFNQFMVPIIANEKFTAENTDERCYING